jgi:hypothetical protein
MASIEKRETSRGVRYDVRYRELGGRQRSKSFRRKGDAERLARTVEVDKIGACSSIRSWPARR